MRRDTGVYVVIPNHCYDEVVKLINTGDRGISSFVKVDFTHLVRVRKGLSMHPKRSKVLYFETITNPLVEVVDIEKVVGLANEFGCITVVDTTWTPPLVQQVFR